MLPLLLHPFKYELARDHQITCGTKDPMSTPTTIARTIHNGSSLSSQDRPDITAVLFLPATPPDPTARPSAVLAAAGGAARSLQCAACSPMHEAAMAPWLINNTLMPSLSVEYWRRASTASSAAGRNEPQAASLLVAGLITSGCHAAGALGCCHAGLTLLQESATDLQCFTRGLEVCRQQGELN